MSSKATFALLVYDEVQYAREFAAHVETHCADICEEILFIVTGENARCLLAESIAGVRCVDAIPSYPGRGRNIAVTSAKGEYVCVFDADLTVDWSELRLWLVYVLAHNICGAAVTRHHLRWRNYASFCYYLWESFFSRHEVRAGYIRILVVTKSFYSTVGSFDESRRAGEDFAFYKRALGHGFSYSVRTIGRYSKYPASLGEIFRKKRLYASFRRLGGRYAIKVCLMLAAICGVVLGSSLLISGFLGAAVGFLLLYLALPFIAILTGSFGGILKTRK